MTGGDEAVDAKAAVYEKAPPGQAGEKNREGGLHKDDLAAKGPLSPEEMQVAMQRMALGRSPISGNPLTGKGRFGYSTVAGR